MRLTPPKKWVFWVSVVLAALAFLGALVSIPVVSAYGFWILLVGFVLLALGNAVKGF